MASANSNRQWIYARRPEGALRTTDFELRQSPIPTPGEGQALARIRMISVDPAQRVWMKAEAYRPILKPGELMPAFALAEVVESKAPSLKPGDIVEGDLGWQDYVVVDPHQVMPRDSSHSLEHLVSVLHVAGGLTAYFGLLEVGHPRPGETVVVSGAAGSVGNVTAQIAKLNGCRAVGVAGGTEKCRWLKEYLGLDAAVDYKAGNLAADLGAACPNGIDVYFDNTGGTVLENALLLMNPYGRIVCCGAIASYDTGGFGATAGIPALLTLKRLRMQGFFASDFFLYREAAEAALVKWVRSGALKVPLTIVEDLENAPQALVDLLKGRNFGKMAIRVS